MPFFCVLKAFWRDFCILALANLIEKIVSVRQIIQVFVLIDILLW